jgi:hypothetical protein
MKTITIFLIFVCLTLASCGTLRVTPQNCKTNNGLWGDSKRDYIQASEFKFSKTYMIYLTNVDIRLRDFLKEFNVKCTDVKKLRMDVKTTFFVKRTLDVYIEK